MGSAYRAKYALLKNEYSFEEIMKNLPEPTLICEPYHDADTVSIILHTIKIKIKKVK